MRTYRCPFCSTVLYFDNLRCSCGLSLTLDPMRDTFVQAAHPCRNRDRIGCNWQAEGDGAICHSCAMTGVHPDLSEPANAALWAQAEASKRWVLAGLFRWRWLRSDDSGSVPQFHLLSERTATGTAPITMGHANGLITINVMEASDATRAIRQERLSERYRTMIGHFRHEIAHFLFFLLAANPTFLTEFRQRFGDERADYAEALERHYATPPVAAGEHHISEYAMAHPHEDWAETAAHLMHMTDLLDSADAVGLRTSKPWPAPFDPYLETNTERRLSYATDMALAVNHVNRALDIPDLYPFVLSQPVRDKLSFAHRWLGRLPASSTSGRAA